MYNDYATARQPGPAAVDPVYMAVFIDCHGSYRYMGSHNGRLGVIE